MYDFDMIETLHVYTEEHNYCFRILILVSKMKIKLTKWFNIGKTLGLNGDKLVISFSGLGRGFILEENPSHCIKKIYIQSHNSTSNKSCLLALVVPWLCDSFELERKGDLFEYTLDFEQIMPHAPESVLKITACLEMPELTIQNMLKEWGLPPGVDMLTENLLGSQVEMRVSGKPLLL